MELIIGTTAAILTTIAFLPQVVLVLKTKQTRDISLVMYLIFTSGVILWLYYGILIEQAPIIFANIVTLIFVSIILVMKVKHG